MFRKKKNCKSYANKYQNCNQCRCSVFVNFVMEINQVPYEINQQDKSGDSKCAPGHIIPPVFSDAMGKNKAGNHADWNRQLSCKCIEWLNGFSPRVFEVLPAHDSKASANSPDA